jgi:excinuclease ABC subunit A
MGGMDNRTIKIRGAREHNLRSINLDLPKNQLIVFTGVSGSGKSSLAFDTLYAEGQRRYVESLSSYARQFLGQFEKPDFDFLGGLSPAISIQQKSAGRNPRSTVGTITEIHDYLRVLYARVGRGHCPICGRPIEAQTREQIIERILAIPEKTRFLVLAPVARGQKGEYRDLFEDMLRRGFVRARVDGEVVRLTEDLKLDKRIKHWIEIVVDRLANEPKVRPRLAEAVEQALALGEESLIVAIEEKNGESGEDLLLSARYACTHCNRSYEPPEPQLFSFNSPQGMCLDCDGLGMRYTFDPALMVPDAAKSFFDGAIPLVGPMKGMGRWRKHIFQGVAETLGIDLKKPWKDVPAQHKDWLLNGAGDRHITYEWKIRGGGVWKHGGKWEGIVPGLLSSFKKTAAGPRRMQLEKYMRVVRCPGCQGARLNPQARAVKVAGRTIVDLCAQPIGDLARWFEPGGELEQGFSDFEGAIASEVLKEVRGRLGFLLNVGLHYLTLERTAPTLSGGEAQRIRLAGQIGCGLVGVLYILDEPSIGLHARDNDRLLASLKRLRDMGNTVIVVEHDEETMRSAGYLVDFGPGPGVRGGEVVASGTVDEVMANQKSLTGQYLSRKREIPIPKTRRKPKPGTAEPHQAITVRGARHHNLQNIDVEFPLGLFIAVTGVSGSGKSSLVNDILKEGLADIGLRPLENGDAAPAKKSKWRPKAKQDSDRDENGNGNGDADEVVSRRTRIVGAHDRLEGIENIDKVIDIDQTPIGRTPRSNPATYIKVFDEIRSLFAELPESKIRGYKPGRFSFNKPGGRCEACEGNGSNRLEMDFLADVWVQCPVCEGRRFNRETLQVHFKGKSIRDVLEMDVQEALVHFENVPKIRNMLQTLHDVGLDYIKLGQASPTLSGGEAQRIKLARELCRRSTGRTLYILDEPTTGLHFEDIQKLLQVLHGFVDAGNTVIVIEHNLDVIKTADWLIDLGPEGGAEGGQIVATGTPERVANKSESFTGQALKKVLAANGRPSKKARPAAMATAARIKKPKSLNGSSDEAREITIQGARQHNLKNIDVSLPRDKMAVCCGPSGSGKSSLALDTLYAEGQRRYIESLSAYARQFLGQMQKPKVDHVSGLSPAISIEQKTTSKSPRSTVGTVTEIYDYLRVLYARLGQPYCPNCGIPVGTQTADEIIDKIAGLPEGTKLYVMAPIERRGQEKYKSLWEEIRRAGFIRMRIDGRSYTVENPPEIDHRRKHEVEVVVDRVIARPGQRGRIAETVEAALDLGKGIVHVAHVDDQQPENEWRVERFSQHFACERCGRSFEPLNPHHFSFNSPLGWCPTCEGLGVQLGASPALLIRDPKRSLREGAIAAWPDLTPDNPFTRFAEAIARHGRFDLDTPFDQLTPAQQRMIIHGTDDAWIELNPALAGRSGRKKASREGSCEDDVAFQYKGLYPAIDEAARISHVYRHDLDYLVTEVPCLACGGSRLRDDAAAVRFLGRTLAELTGLPLCETLEVFKGPGAVRQNKKVAGELLREITSRLQFLVDVGLDYLTLSRPAPTLSGGESQRIRLASQIGSGLTGVLYVLDEPTIGLHPRDNRRLLGALNHLRDLGNTLVLVEHDREIIGAADYLLDFGPGAGDRGGEITARGPVPDVAKAKHSLTGQYLSGRKAIPIPTNRRRASPAARSTGGDGHHGLPSPSGRGEGAVPRSDAPALIVRGARHHNLKNITVRFPLGALVTVTGVSGSGKSSLVNEVLYQTLARKLHRARTLGAAHDEIRGIDQIDKVISVDQDPIGNSPSSNPATYTGVFDLVRQLFAQLPDSKIRGYQARRFSFNKPGGRCEACEGNGQKKIEMHFLPDVWVQCDVCHGQRYNPETLAVRYKGRSIADVLNMRVSEALEVFANIPKIRRVLQTLADVGLDYLSLGQPAPTLSGGEAQRVKLAAELGRPNTGRTLYVLDEPTTGLHFDDIQKLLDVLNRLVDLGNTVIIVEHNMDVIKTADWVIDLGPEAGDAGGELVVAGTPEDVAAYAKSGQKPISHTGEILIETLKAGPQAEREKYDPHQAEAGRDGDLDLEAVGRDARMPWQADGRRWHTRDRLTSEGKPCRWEGEILDWLDQRVHALASFPETEWSDRSVVEIAAPKRSEGWFLHAMTGHEWLLRLVFRVGRNTFKEADLVERLGIRPLNETPGLEVYGNDERVRVGNLKGPWQAVTILTCKKEEIDTPAFADFLKKAAASFQANIARMQLKPEDVMPWKINGERWHLGEKGFPVGKRVQWDHALLSRVLGLIREAAPDVEIHWDSRDAILLKVAGIGQSWGRLKTKAAYGLDCQFLGKRGQFNLSQIERFGVSPTVHDWHGKADLMRLVFQHAEHLHAVRLKELLTAHLTGFMEVWAEKAVKISS